VLRKAIVYQRTGINQKRGKPKRLKITCLGDLFAPCGFPLLD
jgi:hypothetical protein